VLVLVLGSLIAAKTLLGVTVTLPGLPLYASWIVVCAAAVVLVKLVAVHHARRSLGRLRSTIAAAAAAPQAS
jgi:hypothetical protein